MWKIEAKKQATGPDSNPMDQAAVDTLLAQLCPGVDVAAEPVAKAQAATILRPCETILEAALPA